ncbi:hypothetical protein AJ80_01057 [Polytolypa hystricis UAMH7299]|uniref:NmrA-like domain-containing protein n=1 Tax=Polytolypa hystricis (strain UAMH7299) TaxID=1447883 RepID=A0A2B7Z173_POLH7|nr:hypothetical protein AJ80_01057 [Polytolypa hystricis UAMH7299]
MSSPIKNVIVVGPGGNLGPGVINALVQSPHGYNVSALSRQESSYQPPEGVSLRKTDYTHDSLVEALKGQDAIVSAISKFPEQTKLIDAAVAAGVKRFIPSEFGSDSSHPLARERVPAYQAKQAIRDYLQSKQDQIEFTAFITGPFFELCLQSGFFGANLQTGNATVDPKYKHTRFSVSNLPLICQAIAQALSPALAAKTANQILYVRSGTISLEYILSVLRKVSGKEFPETAFDFDTKVKEEQEKVQNNDDNDVSENWVLIASIMLNPVCGNFDERGIVSNQLLGLPEQEDLEATIKAVVA